MEKLAINGGTPIRKNKIYYGRQWIDEKDIEAVTEILRGDFITSGPKIGELENELTKNTGAKYAVVVSSGTAALHCACIAAGLGAGDEAITTPLTFAASANCVLYCSGRPVFADVDPKTYNIDPVSIEKHITEKTKAVIAVDFTGQAVRIDKIKDICIRHNLVFIEDAAHSIGTKYNGRPIGSLADMTCFSFHPVKTVTSGEGGAITTNDEGLYKKLLLARSHGITHSIDEMMYNSANLEPWYYEEISLGFNYRMTDIQAALLVSQLSKLNAFKLRRQEIVKKYNDAFKSIPGIIIQEEIKESDTCRHLYIIKIDRNMLSCDRRTFFNALSEENIQPQVHYIPVYRFPYYKRLGYKEGICPIAEDIYENILSIPLYPKMSDADVEDVINGVKKVANWFLR